MKYPIVVRNNFPHPIRFTLIFSNDEVKIMVGNGEPTLSQFKRALIDRKIQPNEEYEEIGTLTVEADFHFNVSGVDCKETHSQ